MLDQSFANEEGLPMLLVYVPVIGSGSQYEAQVYDSELE